MQKSMQKMKLIHKVYLISYSFETNNCSSTYHLYRNKSSHLQLVNCPVPWEWRILGPFSFIKKKNGTKLHLKRISQLVTPKNMSFVLWIVFFLERWSRVLTVKECKNIFAWLRIKHQLISILLIINIWCIF